MYRVAFSKASRKAFKKLRKSGNFDDELTVQIINVLASGKRLEPQFRNHRLQGKYLDCFECHIKNDLLLMYEIDENQKQLNIINIGSHSELFE